MTDELARQGGSLRRSRWMALALGMLAAGGCSDADEEDGGTPGDTGTADLADGGVESDASDVGEVVLSCFTGDWQLVQVLCDGVDRTADLRDPGGVESMTMAVSALQDGRCEVFVTASGPTCTEVARHVYELSESGDITAVSSGITSCDPDACQFNELDGACVVEDRAGVAPSAITVDGDRVEIEHEPPDGVCGPFEQTTTAIYERIE